MRIKLIQSILKDFKCYADKVIDYSKGNVTTVQGRNEQGKTTIADAFYDTFIKRDYSLNANPSIRPLGREDSIPTVTHICDIDGREVSVTKIQKCSKSKTDPNKITLTNSYEVNSVPKNEITFNAYLEELGLDFKKFLALSHPDSFLSQKQDDMRKVIFELGSAKSDLDIAMMQEDTKDVAEMLKNYKLEEIEAMNKATIKKINDTHGSKGELTEKAIVSKQELKVDLDVAEIELQKNALTEKINEIDKKISDSSSQSKEIADLGQKELQLTFNRNDISRIANDELTKKRREIDRIKDDAQRKFDNCVREISDIERNLISKRNSLTFAQNRREELLKDHKRASKLKFDDSSFVFDESSKFCSLCGQLLPLERIEDAKARFEENKAKAKEKFEADRKNKIAEINNDGLKQNEIIADCEKEISVWESKLKEVQEQENTWNKSIKECTLELSEIPDMADMSQNADYQQKCKEIKEVQDKIASLGNNDGYIAQLKESKEPLLAELRECESKIARVSRNSDIEEQIAELKEKRIEYEQSKADAEKILHQCKEVSVRKDDLLVEEINSHFMFVKWKLWDYQKNGEKKSICVPYFFENGIEKTFTDSMSGGTKIRAKIDICYSLQKFFNMYVPIFVDEASEIDRDRIPGVDTQIILLSRADCDLTIG